MNIQEAFFQISHTKNLSQTQAKAIETLQIKKPINIEAASIFLALGQDNFELFCSLKTSADILDALFGVKLINAADLNIYKTALFLQLKNQEQPRLIELAQNLELEGFISKPEFFSIKVLFSKPLDFKKIQKSELKAQFSARKQRLLDLILDLQKISTNDNFIKALDLIQETAKENIFSVGITGVMNAGKSSMLNVLLGKEILGTSVIPETANLTVLRHSKTEFARVNYYTVQEWQAIEQEKNKKIKTFVDETRAIFGDTLEKTLETQSIEVPINSLSSYTSAKHSNGKCNLVRSVDLYTDLEFLEQGVQIVDTPGIDDPITRREEITKEFLQKCNLVLHLMNAAQTATAKDIEFLIDNVLYQNIPKTIILITKIDAVSDKDLQESISFTKKAIKEALLNLGKENLIKPFLEKLEFLPISSKLALEDNENSGFKELKQSLFNVLFGKEKQDLEVKKILDEILKALNQELSFSTDLLESLEKGEENAQAELLALEKQNKELCKIIEASKQKDLIVLEEFADFTNSLDNFFITETNYFYDKFLDRLSQNFSHKAKLGESLDDETIEFITGFGIKDAIIDIARDYRYMLVKKLQEKSLPHDLQVLENGFLPRFLNKNNSSLAQELKLIAKHKTKDKQALQESIGLVLRPAFLGIKDYLLECATVFKTDLIKALETNALEKHTKEQNALDLKLKGHKALINSFKNNASKDMLLALQTTISSLVSNMDFIRDNYESF